MQGGFDYRLRLLIFRCWVAESGAWMLLPSSQVYRRMHDVSFAGWGETLGVMSLLVMMKGMIIGRRRSRRWCPGQLKHSNGFIKNGIPSGLVLNGKSEKKVLSMYPK
jgi:hypothetical protein